MEPRCATAVSTAFCACLCSECIRLMDVNFVRNPYPYIPTSAYPSLRCCFCFMAGCCTAVLGKKNFIKYVTSQLPQPQAVSVSFFSCFFFHYLVCYLGLLLLCSFSYLFLVSTPSHRYVYLRTSIRVVYLVPGNSTTCCLFFCDESIGAMRTLFCLFCRPACKSNGRTAVPQFDSPRPQHFSSFLHDKINICTNYKMGHEHIRQSA